MASVFGFSNIALMMDSAVRTTQRTHIYHKFQRQMGDVLETLKQPVLQRRTLTRWMVQHELAGGQAGKYNERPSASEP